MKKIKKSVSGIILSVAIIEMILLILMVPAESYTIHQTDSSSENLMINDGKDNKIKEIFDAGITLLIGFLSIKEIGFASATEPTIACCLDTCDNVLSNYEGCSQDLIMTSCEDTSECRRGCCFDSEEGTCATNSPKGTCESDGGEWSNDATCSMGECRRGCCVLGNNVRFTTEKNCEKISIDEMDFRQIWNERDCLALTASQIEGACVLSSKNCKFETGTQCSSDRGKFYEGYLCSHDALDTKCEKQDSTGCVEGKDEIYWFDSCGNMENIYSSDKITSWNNGFVLPEGESCNSGTANIGSTDCGNCELSLNSKCSETEIGEAHIADGNFVCKDLRCYDAPDNVGTSDRINGEKWCIYEGFIGDGKDTVGSENYLAFCHDGEVEVDRCGEYRTHLCQQQTITEGTNSYTTASCVPNEAIFCKQITADYFDSEMTEEDLEVMTTDCEKKEHCMIKNVDLGEYFRFSMCVPRYPRGDILTDDADGGLCGMATQNCSVYYEKDFLGTWVAKYNTQCESAEFAKQMNELCISIGDCGSKVNYVGGGTDSVKITGKKGFKLDDKGVAKTDESSTIGSAPAPYSWTNYKQYAETVDGQVVEPLDINDELTAIFGKDYDPTDPTVVSQIVDWAGAITGTVGSLGISAVFLAGNYGNIITILGSGLGAVFTVVLAFAIGAALGYFIGTLGDRSPDATLFFMIVGGAGAALTVLFTILYVEGSTGPYGWIAAVVTAVVAVVLILIGIFTGYGERETRIVEFKCLPWVAPNGGADCEKCDDNPLMPCTEYKCSSLGQLCKLENEREENPICIKLDDETNPPVISAEKVVTEGHEFNNEEAGKGVSITGCIEEFKRIWFTLKTDEYAQCKYSFTKPSIPDFEEMEGYLPVEQNLFGINHTFYFPVPSIDNENVYDIVEVENGAAKEGKLDMYVKCQDGQAPPNFNINEYMVQLCVRSGPDETAVNFARMIAEPDDGDILKYGTTESELKIWTDEKVESCKYDTVAGRSYDTMKNTFTLGVEEFQGWLSSTTLTGLVAGENKFYIKCKDVSRNINSEDFVYTLKVSESELKVDSVSFSYGVKKIASGGTFSAGMEPISVEMEVKTSGGGYNGKAGCFWGVLDGGNRWLFKDTFSTVHKQVLSPRFQGTFTNYIYCKDDAENEAISVGEFIVDVDNSPPKVIRAFKDGTNLKIVTNELAKCYYNLDKCNFNLKNGTSMTSAFSKVHSALWKEGIIYHIRCEDVYGNINPDCGIEIVPSV